MMPRQPASPPNYEAYALLCKTRHTVYGVLRVGAVLIGATGIALGGITMAYELAAGTIAEPDMAAHVARSAETMGWGLATVAGGLGGYALAMSASERRARRDFRIPPDHPAPEAFRPFTEQYVVQLPPDDRPPEQRSPQA